MSEPKVTVSLITYNHAPFIAQAIESVLAQETSFPFELVIGEDDSSDGTRDIVREYATRHPGKIRLHLHERSANIHYGGLPTGRHNLVHNLRSARGQYIALLDGDDYYSDPQKLQRQVDFLEAHPECSTCFHRVQNMDESGAFLPTGSQVQVVREIYNLPELLRGELFLRTASVMFRRGLFADFPQWYFSSPVGDFPIHVFNGLKGSYGFLDRVMSCYRLHTGGRWSNAARAETPEQQQVARTRRLRQLRGTVHLYELLEKELRGPHRQAAREMLAVYRYRMANLLHLLGQTETLRTLTTRIWQARPLLREINQVDLLLLTLEAWLPLSRRLVSALRGHLASPPHV